LKGFCLLYGDETPMIFIMKTNVAKTIKRKATKILGELKGVRTPLVITERGRPAAYVVDAQTYEQMQSRMRLLEGIARGEQAIEWARIVTHAQAKKRLRRWLG